MAGGLVPGEAVGVALGVAVGIAVGDGEPATPGDGLAVVAGTVLALVPGVGARIPEDMPGAAGRTPSALAPVEPVRFGAGPAVAAVFAEPAFVFPAPNWVDFPLRLTG